MPCLSKCNFGAILLQNAKLVVKNPSELVHMNVFWEYWSHVNGTGPSYRGTGPKTMDFMGPVPYFYLLYNLMG